MYLDGMQFAEMPMVGAVGIRIGDDKHMLGFEKPSPENEQVSTRYLLSVGAQGLNLAEGPLVITDDSKGLQAAVRKAFGCSAPPKSSHL